MANAESRSINRICSRKVRLSTAVHAAASTRGWHRGLAAASNRGVAMPEPKSRVFTSGAIRRTQPLAKTNDVDLFTSYVTTTALNDTGKSGHLWTLLTKSRWPKRAIAECTPVADAFLAHYARLGVRDGSRGLNATEALLV